MDWNEIFMSTDRDVCECLCVYNIHFQSYSFEILSFFKFSCVLIGKKNILIVILIKTDLIIVLIESS